MIVVMARAWRTKLAVAVVGALCAAACGDGQAPPTEIGTVGGMSVAGTEVVGNLVSQDVKQDESVVVFAYPADSDLSKAARGRRDDSISAGQIDQEPLSVGVVDREGAFAMSGLEAPALSIVFLTDGASDGVIDPGDAVALLGDPNDQLSELQAGDRIILEDIRLDFERKRAVAAHIEVIRFTPPAPTPTSAPQSGD
jgi:hypothetical protein